jgi:formyl-CoA transferase
VEIIAMTKADFYRHARSDVPGPLAGVRVVEATTTWAGPMCGSILADLGADVVKIEIPGGEVSRLIGPMLPGTSVSFAHATVNRNKRSLTLDLRRAEGRDLFLRLAARADILVENFSAGTLDGWGLGYDAVRAVKSDIVYVSITGWGQFGPYHPSVGYDPMASLATAADCIRAQTYPHRETDPASQRHGVPIAKNTTSCWQRSFHQPFTLRHLRD